MSIQEWVDRDPQNAKVLAQEEFILDVTEGIWTALEDQKLSKSDLAEKLGQTKAHVSQLLSGSRNMTLRSLSDIAWALDMVPRIGFSKKGSYCPANPIHSEVVAEDTRWFAGGRVVTIASFAAKNAWPIPADDSSSNDANYAIRQAAA